ncbi:alpha/beta hydrolase [Polynucleobacter kasalickyi]|uniref:Lysophospholipase, alpha-beta hydrolase superfamily n=1 Tax=Polynucleobacter kasalickyi TaxID=1938817 RepID=A0A1W1Y5U0_9BURK|nr:alpha/beta fold hydrolase [Polynucleobacter kasalickyi]SMC31542.1 Lysophospholipase, alpha-beta hydrolase superfamily [Polynucleobacter kasalickyi]
MSVIQASVEGQTHWAYKEEVKLFLWQKKRFANTNYRGTILFIHGSSWCSQPTFDLQVDGRSWSSVMDFFASKGYDTWCLDNEGYGRSDKSRDINFGVENGAQDIVAATDYILKHDAIQQVLLYGISSGALKSALFTQWYPERVSRLALDAFVWTGEGSPTLVERRKMLPNLVGVNRRPFNREVIQSVFDRDHPGTADQKMIDAFATASLELDDSVPTGTYVDMCTKLPMVDPLKVTVPTIMMRGEYDGIAGIDDLIEFFRRLPNTDKHFAVMPGVAHASFQQTNYLLVYDVLLAFFSQTPAVFLAK